ncbi:MAG: hypothetical protein HOF75_00020 [Flavobacteriaceae bacterium]|jgi:hypothetical protein|nr:hypothetical protein [Flavobacteriaceae bacterium]MBT3920588.1 hypothetical protein [Flavobacteriaceae bacterium]MBT6705762.1 hypothetical protein [Flavobacteriaceae bacterium]MBT7243390.1 hypothetical protein [Flavobacteriaceae bacterium]
MNLKGHIKIALGYFFIVAILGVCMRMFQVVDFDFNYKNILHTHSHIALLGWVYTALITIIYQLFLSNKQLEKPYKRLFWSTQISILGMMFTFPFTGYALLSIIFSTYFLINSYVFVRLFLKHTSIEQKKTNSYKLIRASLWLMVLSSIGPWALGGIMNTLGSASSWYRNAIYFYLHFQYNGWFLVALLGILFFIFEKHSISFSQKTFKLFFKLFLGGVILTFFLSVLWMQPNSIFYFLAGIGSVFQIAAFVVLFNAVFQNKQLIKKPFTKLEGVLLKTVGLLFFVKLLFQLIGAFPAISEIIKNNIDFVIAYLHWIFLGIVTISVFAFLNYFKLFRITKTNYVVYLIAFIITESLLFYKGFVLWFNSRLIENYYLYLVIASTVFLIAITWLLVLQINKKNTSY